MKNRMVKEKRLWAIVAVTLAALLLFAACAPGPAKPEGKKIEFANIASLTGGGASEEQRGLAGVLDWVKYFNEEEMIPGVTVEVVWRDCFSSLAGWVSAYESLKARGIPVMMSNYTTGLDARQAKLENDQIPLSSGNPAQEIVYPPHWYYFCAPTWAEKFAVLADYIMETWQGESPPRLVFIAFDNPFGRQIEVTGTKYAESIGFEMLPMEMVPFVPIDTTTQLLRVKERGADYVYISGLIVTAGPVLRDAERLGLLGQIHFCGAESSLGPELIQMAGAASEGYLAPYPYPSFDETDVPGIKLMMDNQMKYHGKVVNAGEGYVGMWTMTAITCEAIRRAVENVGYENLDGPAIKQAFDSISNFDVYGLTTITYNPPDDQRGSNKAAIYQVIGGQIVRVTDWLDAPMLAPEE